MSHPKSKILDIFSAFKELVLHKNSDNLIDLYTEDVRIFDMWDEGSYSGKSKWKPIIVNWLSSLGNETVVVDFSGIEIKEDTVFATATAIVHYKAIDSEGNELRKMKNRISWSLTNTDGNWQIFHQHTSVPIDANTTKAISLF